MSYKSYKERYQKFHKHFADKGTKVAFNTLLEMSDNEEGLLEVRRISKESIQNPTGPEQIGRYVPDWMSKSVTANRELLDYCYFELKRPVPSLMAAGPREILAFPPDTVRAAIVSCGGNCPGINAVIHGIVSRHYQYANWKYDENDPRVIGYIGGWKGIKEGKYKPLDPIKVRDQRGEGGSILKMLREESLKDEEAGSQEFCKIADALKENKIDILYAIGGDGTARAAHKLAETIREKKYSIAVAVLPKSIDNDTSWIWETFGFKSVIEAAAEDLDRFHTDMKTSERIGIVAMMGRLSGALTLSVAAASGKANIVLIREALDSFNPGAFLNHLHSVYENNDPKHAIVLVAEGIDAAPGIKGLGIPGSASEIIKKLVKNDNRFEDIKPVTDKPGYAVRGIDPNYFDKNYCQRLGNLAVDNALAGWTDFLMSQWLTEYVLVPLELVNKSNKYISPKGLFYLQVTRNISDYGCGSAQKI